MFVLGQFEIQLHVLHVLPFGMYHKNYQYQQNAYSSLAPNHYTQKKKITYILVEIRIRARDMWRVLSVNDISIIPHLIHIPFPVLIGLKPTNDI